MEILYAFGIICIQILQNSCEDFEWLLDTFNEVFNPHYLMEYVFPLVSACDSVFGAQLMLSIAFGGWCNTMLKWILVEDRPFWWVRETTYYSKVERPMIRQNIHSCETGPGSPSGHCAAASTIFMLAEMWLCHVIRDLKSKKLEDLHDLVPVKLVYFLTMGLVAMARMYVGAHFPHQCLLGALIGSFLSPYVCLFITDPYLLGTSGGLQDTRRGLTRHVGLACGAIALSMLLGLVYLILGIDLHWSTRLAFRWCQSADFINVKSSPIFAIVQSTSSLLGWALAVTPEVAKYRHNTRTRNTFVAILLTSLAMYGFKHVQEYIPNRRVPYYALHFALNLVKPFVFLRLLPKIAMLTYFGPPEPVTVSKQSRQTKTAARVARTGERRE